MVMDGGCEEDEGHELMAKVGEDKPNGGEEEVEEEESLKRRWLMVSMEEDEGGVAMGEFSEVEECSMQGGEDTTLHVIFNHVLVAIFAALNIVP